MLCIVAREPRTTTRFELRALAVSTRRKINARTPASAGLIAIWRGCSQVGELSHRHCTTPHSVPCLCPISTTGLCQEAILHLRPGAKLAVAPLPVARDTWLVDGCMQPGRGLGRNSEAARQPATHASSTSLVARLDWQIRIAGFGSCEARRCPSCSTSAAASRRSCWNNARISTDTTPRRSGERTSTSTWSSVEVSAPACCSNYRHCLGILSLQFQHHRRAFWCQMPVFPHQLSVLGNMFKHALFL